LAEKSTRPVVRALVASLVAYAAVAATRQWWPSVVTAAVVAVLLWRCHPRARFAAYIFFTVLAIRGAATGVWSLPVYSLVAVALMQTAGARQAWPRLVRGRVGSPGDRMRGS
jgi:hypothetical protein